MHSVHFHGHACVSLLGDGFHLLVDPFRAGDFGGLVDIHPICGEFTHVVSTHEHADHAHFAAAPQAQRCDEPNRTHPGFQWERVPVWHDIHEGRLRGGVGGAIVVRASGVTVVHLGDVGEPASVAATSAFPQRADLLIVPCGGYFTVGAAEALDWIRLLHPRRALLCHASDQGVRLPQMSRSSEAIVRLGSVPWQRVTNIRFDCSEPQSNKVAVYLAVPPRICGDVSQGLRSASGGPQCQVDSRPDFDTACCET